MYFSFNGLCHSQKKSKIVAVRTVIIKDVEMYALRRGSAYVHVHTDIYPPSSAFSTVNTSYTESQQFASTLS